MLEYTTRRLSDRADTQGVESVYFMKELNGMMFHSPRTVSDNIIIIALIKKFCIPQMEIPLHGHP